jgi:LemA protein
MPTRLLAVLAFAATLLSGCGYNQIQINDEGVNAAWSEVLNQYKRRADLIPNLVQTVQGYAAHEKEVLTRVSEARANVAGIKATPELINDPAAFAKFQKVQGELGGALARLLAVVENYPQLKADANFRDLQAQLEGTENRITVARNRYIKAVQEYNISVRTFPNNLTAMVMGWQTKPNFTVEDEKAISAPPKVNFGAARAPTTAPAQVPPRHPRRPPPATSRTAWRARCWPSAAGWPCCAVPAALPSRCRCRRCRPASPTSRPRSMPRSAAGSRRNAGRHRPRRARAGRRAAAADYRARDHRTIRYPPRRGLEDWPQGRRRRPDHHRRQGRPTHAHRSRLWPRRARFPTPIASRIVNERMAPAFRQGDFFGGLDAAIAAHRPGAGWHGGGGPARARSGRGDRRRDARGLDRVAVHAGDGCRCAARDLRPARFARRRRQSAAGWASWSSGPWHGGHVAAHRSCSCSPSSASPAAGAAAVSAVACRAVVASPAAAAAASAAAAPRGGGEMKPARMPQACAAARLVAPPRLRRRRPGGRSGRPSPPAKGHRGELRFVVEAGLPPAALWRDTSPRQRAAELFASERVWDTEENSGILIYVELADRRVEILADRGIAARVAQAEWDAICRAMEQAFGAGRWREGGACRRGARVRTAGGALSRRRTQSERIAGPAADALRRRAARSARLPRCPPPAPCRANCCTWPGRC